MGAGKAANGRNCFCVFATNEGRYHRLQLTAIHASLCCGERRPGARLLIMLSNWEPGRAASISSGLVIGGMVGRNSKGSLRYFGGVNQRNLSLKRSSSFP